MLSGRAVAVEGGEEGKDPQSAVPAVVRDVLGLAVAHEIDRQQRVGVVAVEFRRQDGSVAVVRLDIVGAELIGAEVGVVAEEHALREIRRVGVRPRRHRVVERPLGPPDAVGVALFEETEAIGRRRLIGPVLCRVGVDDGARVLGQLVLVAGEGEVGVGDVLEEVPQNRLGDAHARLRVVAGARQHAEIGVGSAVAEAELGGHLGGPDHRGRGVEEDQNVGLGGPFAEKVAIIGSRGRGDSGHDDGRDHPAPGWLYLISAPSITRRRREDQVDGDGHDRHILGDGRLGQTDEEAGVTGGGAAENKSAGHENWCPTRSRLRDRRHPTAAAARRHRSPSRCTGRSSSRADQGRR